MTLDAAEIDLSQAFEKGMGYVALSRVRSLEGIRLLGINETALEVHPEALEKDAEFRALSKRAREAYHLKDSEEIVKLHNDFIRVCGGRQSTEYGNREIQIYNNFSSHSRHRVRQERRCEQTYALIQKGKTISEVARERGRTEGTILNHLEEMRMTGKLNPQKLLHLGDGQKVVVSEIHAEFHRLGAEKLKPIYEALGGRHPYETIRVARLLFAEEIVGNQKKDASSRISLCQGGAEVEKQ